jgi:hypothetical protein
MLFSVVTFCNLWKKEKEGAKDAKVFLFAIDYFHLLKIYIERKMQWSFSLKKLGSSPQKKKV